MPESRRYHLQNERANRQIEELLETMGVPRETRGYFLQLLTTSLKLFEDGAHARDLKITNTALKEIRYAFKVFAPYATVPKVTMFGSARTPPDAPASVAARDFGRRMVQQGWMAVTGAGAGIMGAAQEGAGAEQSFGLNIRLPFEQEANPWIASDPKLITFKYFFTRKLFLVKEASAVALFPGGYGTCDEAFELLVLIQTGKSPIVPIVMLEVGDAAYWRPWERFVVDVLAGGGFIEGTDTSLFRVVDTVDDGIAEILKFYRAFHSSRLVGDNVVFRLKQPLSEAILREVQDRFDDILKGRADQVAGPLPQEAGEHPLLHRLILPFNRSSYARLRQLIDFLNVAAA